MIAEHNTITTTMENFTNGTEKIKKKRGRPPKNRPQAPLPPPPPLSPPKRKKVGNVVKKRAYNKWGLEEMAEEFLRVCQFGQTGTAQVMLRKGAPINAQDKLSRNTGLHEAAGMGYGELVKIFLKHPDVDLNLKNIHEETALQVATDATIRELLQEEIAFRQELFGKKGELYQRVIQAEDDEDDLGSLFSQDDRFVLKLAVKLNMPRILKEYHSLHPQKTFDMLFEERRTLLHEACRWSSPEAAQCLLDYGADVFALDSANKLPSEYVAPQCKDLRKIFRKYARKHEIEDERVMLPPTQRALSPEDSEMEEADDQVNMKDAMMEEDNPRHTLGTTTVAGAGSKERMPVTLSREERKLQQLLGILERADSANNPPPPPTVPTTAPPVAVKRGPGRPRKNSLPSPTVVEQKQQQVEQQRQPPLKRKSTKVKERIGDEVFVIPQDPDDGIFNPNKPRDYTKKHKKLQKRKSSVSTPVPTATVNSTSGSGAFDPLLRDKATQRTLLHKAASRNNMEKAKELISKAAELVNMQDNGGYLPLHEAALKGHVQMVELLVEAGSNVNCAAENGDTPLHDASENGHLAVVKLLMRKGADVTRKNAQGLTPVDVSYADVYEHFTTLGYSRNEQASLTEEEDLKSYEERRARKNSVTSTSSVKVEKTVKRRKKRHIVSKKEKKIKPEKEVKRGKKSSNSVSTEPIEEPSPILRSDESSKENSGVKTVTAPEKIYLVNHQGTWHFLSRQIERFYENSLNIRGFRQNNQHIYKGVHVTSEDYSRVTKSNPTTNNSNSNEGTFACELLEKDAVYSVFRRDGVPLGSIPVVFSDASLGVTKRSSSVHLPPKMRMKLNGGNATTPSN